ncbi:unnamed protein product [Leptosia nina]|uniref:Phospholipase A2-like central domain-containing protein n=1 Tax=Leptosia nina TaxID=320188 RepID=A0AAV1J448_9NEOP
MKVKLDKAYVQCGSYQEYRCKVMDVSYRPTRLTYEHIYNTTKYAQIRPTRPIYEQNKQKSYVRTKNLLVGFAHDPFRYSVPEADYRRGVRVIEPQQHTNRTDRGKRGVSHLYNMLTCTTGCNPIDYKGYGCYCGLGGSGRPADGIDNILPALLLDLFQQRAALRS